jgi:hypothetical protein
VSLLERTKLDLLAQHDGLNIEAKSSSASLPISVVISRINIRSCRTPCAGDRPRVVGKNRYTEIVTPKCLSGSTVTRIGSKDGSVFLVFGKQPKQISVKMGEA